MEADGGPAVEAACAPVSEAAAAGAVGGLRGDNLFDLGLLRSPLAFNGLNGLAPSYIAQELLREDDEDDEEDADLPGDADGALARESGIAGGNESELDRLRIEVAALREGQRRVNKRGRGRARR